MIDFELWKNEIIDSILHLHEETKLIREHLEEEKEEEKENVLDVHEEQEVQEEETENVLDVHEEQEVQEEEGTETEIIILQKLDEINDSINILNKTVVESSIVLAITIVLALSFHYFVNQISKW